MKTLREHVTDQLSKRLHELEKAYPGFDNDGRRHPFVTHAQWTVDEWETLCANCDECNTLRPNADPLDPVTIYEHHLTFRILERSERQRKDVAAYQGSSHEGLGLRRERQALWDIRHARELRKKEQER